MNASRTVTFFLLGLLCLLPGASVPQPTENEPAREIMWLKLDLSHNVLDALALEDFEALDAYAADLETLGAAELIFINDTDDYRARVDEFRSAARALKHAAESENPHAGALAYMDLTLRCIACHRAFEVSPR